MATLDGFFQAFVWLGYQQCEQGDLEAGFEKVAIYAHAARQLSDGKSYTYGWGGGILISGNLDPASLKPVTLTYTQQGWPGTGNYSQDPQFTDPAGSDYHENLPGGRF